MYAPVEGKVLDVNEQLTSEPQAISAGAMDDGWLVKIHVSDASELSKMMDENAYKEFLKTQDDH